MCVCVCMYYSSKESIYLLYYTIDASSYEVKCGSVFEVSHKGYTDGAKNFPSASHEFWLVHSPSFEIALYCILNWLEVG